jgi:hypothetical protein
MISCGGARVMAQLQTEKMSFRMNPFSIQQALELYDFYTHQIKICDQEIEKIYKQLPMHDLQQEPSPQLKSRDDRRLKHHPEPERPKIELIMLYDLPPEVCIIAIVRSVPFFVECERGWERPKPSPPRHIG